MRPRRNGDGKQARQDNTEYRNAEVHGNLAGTVLTVDRRARARAERYSWRAPCRDGLLIYVASFRFRRLFPLPPCAPVHKGEALNQVIPTVMSNREVLLPRDTGPARLLSSDINLPKLNAVTSHCHS